MLLSKRALIILACIATVLAQRSCHRGFEVSSPELNPTSLISQISKGAEDFSLELFSTVSNALTGSKNNYMISPFSVWALMLLVAEGAGGRTLSELHNTLRITNNTYLLRQGYSSIEKALKVKTNTVEVSILQALFYDKNRPVQPDYENVIQCDYQAELVSTDFYEPSVALDTMSRYVLNATRGLINPAFTPSDLEDANLIMISSIYFKGQWKLPFNKSFTKDEPFYDDNGEVITYVQMMTQTGPFNYAPIVDMESHILELPYGSENRLSMLIVVPKKGVRLNDAIYKLRQVGLERVFNELKRKEDLMAEYDDDEVEVFMPKFITTTSFVMNTVLEEMGIIDVFQKYANLSKISPQAYLSRIIHQTKIEVNEEGTIAAAVTSGIFANKASPPRFYLNRPFAYLIVEKTTRSLLFCGQVTKPVYNP